MSPTLRFLLPLLSALVLLAPAHAARRVALLIGNSQYQHESLLPNPVRDVELLAKTLQGLEFKTEVLKNLPRREMDLAIKRFVRESAGADTALLYYAGHGQQPSKGGRSYLLPVNANTVDDDALEADGILAEDIAGQLERLGNPAKLRLIILDACRNTRAVSRSSVRGLAPPARTDSYTLIAYSTDANSVAQDGQGANSPYAQALAQNLARATREPVRRVFEETAKAVRQATRQQQSPRTYGDLESHVGLDGVQLATLVVAPTATPIQADPEQEAWELAKKRDTVAAYQAYLDTYPKGSYADPARVAIKGLQPTQRPAPQSAASHNQPSVQPAATSTATAQPGQSFKDCADCPEMVVIPSGSFQMGSNDGDDEEKPIHTVTLRSFALGKYEVTQGQWKAVMGNNPSKFNDCSDTCPVDNVSWNDVQQFIQKLNQKTGQNYRLPSEAEWEYTARAGTSTKYWWGDSVGHEQANYGTGICCAGWMQSSDKWFFSSPVGQFPANAFGLFDTSGNLWEWVQDVWHDDYNGAPSDGSAWMSGGDHSIRVRRGGSWYSTPQNLRSANRSWAELGYRDNEIGFRLAKPLP